MHRNINLKATKIEFYEGFVSGFWYLEKQKKRN